MPVQPFRLAAEAASTPQQFLVYLYNIQVKYLAAVKGGSPFRFMLGSRDCPVLGDLLTHENMSKFLTSDKRLRTFIAFMQRLEEHTGQRGQVREEHVRQIMTQREGQGFF